MIDEICSSLSVDPSKTIKVGDTAIDIDEGKNAQVGMTVGVTTGAQTFEMIAHSEPDYIINGMSALPELMGLSNH